MAFCILPDYYRVITVGQVQYFGKWMLAQTTIQILDLPNHYDTIVVKQNTKCHLLFSFLCKILLFCPSDLIKIPPKSIHDFVLVNLNNHTPFESRNVLIQHPTCDKQSRCI